MKMQELRDKILQLYYEIKEHLEGLRLHDDTVNICSQIWFNHLEVGEQLDIMIDVYLSEKIKVDVIHTCIYAMTRMIEA